MRYIHSLASYLPALIVEHLTSMSEEAMAAATAAGEDADATASGTGSGAERMSVSDLVQAQRPPFRQSLETCCVFADVSGFTALSEAMALNGKGAEGLAKHLNSYFAQMVRLIASDGGDVFKFAGDAMIILWPESADAMDLVVRRAAQCAFAIQEELHEADLEEGVQLSVKIGIGVGKVSVLHIGGVYKRMEYLAVGDPLIQAFASEHHAVAGQVICSAAVWDILRQNGYQAEHTFDDGFARLDLSHKAPLVRKQSKVNMLNTDMLTGDPVLEDRIKGYVAGAVLPNLTPDSPESEQWGNEVRCLTTMFVNLGLSDQQLVAAAQYEEAMIEVHEVLVNVQQAVYEYEGSINKFLMDDKGSTLIACYGLPPNSHEDDSIRAVLGGLNVCERLYDLGLVSSIGITTGDVFCGVVGSKTRREYTCLGDTVNLSARLMQRAGQEGGGVLCDWETKSSSSGALSFVRRDEISVKGKSVPIKVFHPYPEDGTHSVVGTRGPNIYRHIHRQQLQNVAVHAALSALQRYFYRQSLRATTGMQVMSDKRAMRHLSLTEGQGGMPGVSGAVGAGGGPGGAGVTGVGAGGDGNGGNANSNNNSSTGASTAVTRAPRFSAVNLLSGAAADVGGSSPAIRNDTRRGSRHAPTEAGLTPLVKLRARRPKSRLSAGSGTGVLSPGAGVSDPSSVSVLVRIPRELRLQTLDTDSPELPLLTLSDLRGSLADMLVSIVQMAYDQEYITDEQISAAAEADLGLERQMRERLGSIGGEDDEEPDSGNSASGIKRCCTGMTLNIQGSRSFLPDSKGIDVSWLPIFVDEARRTVADTDDGVSDGDTIELTLTLQREKLNIQSRLALARQALLESKINLCVEGTGSVIVLEGDAGVGKTEILSGFISRTLPRRACIYATSACPFMQHQPFGPWSIVVQQYLDAKAQSSGQGISRTDLLLLELQDSSALSHDAYLMNELLGTDCPQPPPALGIVPSVSTSEALKQGGGLLSTTEKRWRQLRIFFHLLLQLAAFRRSVIIIDDAHLLDQYSWELARAVTQGRIVIQVAHAGSGAPSSRGGADAGVDTSGYIERVMQSPNTDSAVPLMLVLACRPVVTSISIFRPIPVEYQLLTQCANLRFLKLDGLPPEEIEELVVQKLGVNVASINDTLFKLIEERCFGNPSVVISLLSALQGAQPPVLRYQEIITSDNDPEDSYGEEGSITVNDYGTPIVTASGAGGEGASATPAGAARAAETGDGTGDGDGTGGGLRVHTQNPLGGIGSAPATPQTARSPAGVLMSAARRICETHVSLNDDYSMDTVPLPPSVGKAIISRLDRFNSCQIMILKTAAVLGQHFKWSFLTHAYPIDGHKHRLNKEMQQLEFEGVVVEVQGRSEPDVLFVQHQPEAMSPKSADAARRKRDRTFVFTHGFMVDSLKRRMLQQQKEYVRERVDRYQSTVDAARRRRFMEKWNTTDASRRQLMRGTLEVQKQGSNSLFKTRFKRRIQGGDWKRRYCVLDLSVTSADGPQLSMYRDDSRPADPNAIATQVIYLRGAAADHEPDKMYGKDFAFHILTNRWRKDDKIRDETRTFVFAAEDRASADDWVYMLKYAIESDEKQQADAREAAKSGRAGVNAANAGHGGGGGGSGGGKMSDDDIEQPDTAAIQPSAVASFYDPVTGVGRTTLTHDDELLPGAESADMLAVVRVQNAQRLLNAGVYGTPSPYIIVRKGDMASRTTMPSGMALAPRWDEDFVFPTNALELTQECLKVEVWSRDIFLSDDYLGHIFLPLKDARVVKRGAVERPAATSTGEYEPDVGMSESSVRVSAQNDEQAASATNALSSGQPVNSMSGSQSFSGSAAEDRMLSVASGDEDTFTAVTTELVWETQWYTLKPRKDYEPVCGEIVVTMRIILGAELTRRLYAEFHGDMPNLLQTLRSEALASAGFKTPEQQEEHSKRVAEAHRLAGTLDPEPVTVRLANSDSEFGATTAAEENRPSATMSTRSMDSSASGPRRSIGAVFGSVDTQPKVQQQQQQQGRSSALTAQALAALSAKKTDKRDLVSPASSAQATTSGSVAAAMAREGKTNMVPFQSQENNAINAGSGGARPRHRTVSEPPALETSVDPSNPKPPVSFAGGESSDLADGSAPKAEGSPSRKFRYSRRASEPFMASMAGLPHVPGSEDDMARSSRVADVQAHVLRRIEALLETIRKGAAASPTKPTKESKVDDAADASNESSLQFVDRRWIEDELRSLCEQVDAGAPGGWKEASLKRSNSLLAHTQDLDDTHMDWLRSQYMRGSDVSSPSTGGANTSLQRTSAGTPNRPGLVQSPYTNTDRDRRGSGFGTGRRGSRPRSTRSTSPRSSLGSAGGDSNFGEENAGASYMDADCDAGEQWYFVGSRAPPETAHSGEQTVSQVNPLHATQTAAGTLPLVQAAAAGLGGPSSVSPASGGNGAVAGRSNDDGLAPHEVLSGPHTLLEMVAWYRAGYLHEQVRVRHGKGKREFVLLGLMLPAMQKLSRNSSQDWLVSTDFLDSVSNSGNMQRQFNRWEFNIWNLQLHELFPLTIILFTRLHLHKTFNMSSEMFRDFMAQVEMYMTKHSNPYHNMYHAVDVCQTSYVFVTTMGASQFLDELEIFALLTASLVHDLDHPGTNNAYHINAQSELAVRYNDQSPLENHHVALAFQLIYSKCNIFRGLDKEQQKHIRRLMILSIIATDMTFHFALKDELDMCVVRAKEAAAASLMEDAASKEAAGGAGGHESGPGANGTTDANGAGDHTSHGHSADGMAMVLPTRLSSDKDREILLKTLLHTADISNPAKAWDLSKKWSDAVIQEFFAQGDREKAENLPVSPNMDRETTEQAALSVNFIDFIVAPYFIALHSLLPRVRTCCVQLSHNRALWDRRNEDNIRNRFADDSSKMQEELARIERRQAAFACVVSPILLGHTEEEDSTTDDSSRGDAADTESSGVAPPSRPT